MISNEALHLRSLDVIAKSKVFNLIGPAAIAKHGMRSCLNYRILSNAVNTARTDPKKGSPDTLATFRADS
jgi:hypothetical protein